MEPIDISLPIDSGLPSWPGSMPFQLRWTRRMDQGQSCNNSRFASDTHCGTHIDAPLHFIPGGAPVQRISLEVLVGVCRVVHLPDIRAITAEHLAGAGIETHTRRLLLRTDNSHLWSKEPSVFQKDFVHLSESAARWCVTAGIELVGIDYLSIGAYRGGEETHRILLEKGIVIVEGLNLSNVAPGTYELTCLPLKLRGAEGAPARAILRPLRPTDLQGVNP